MESGEGGEKRGPKVLSGEREPTQVAEKKRRVEVTGERKNLKNKLIVRQR